MRLWRAMLDSVSLGTSVDGSYVKYILTTCFEWDLILVSTKTPKRRSLHICEKTLLPGAKTQRGSSLMQPLLLCLFCVLLLRAELWPRVSSVSMQTLCHISVWGHTLAGRRQVTTLQLAEIDPCLRRLSPPIWCWEAYAGIGCSVMLEERRLSPWLLGRSMQV